jgi:molecular chaperone GrpE
MIKHIDMTDKNIKDQEVTEEQGFNEADATASSNDASCDNMADGEQQSTDTMAEESPAEEQNTAEPTPEEIIAVWRDKYMRLQAEFDNYRKRTLREKMDLVASGGADVIKSMLSVLDDMYRAVAASEKSEDITALREGEKLVLQKFEEALRQKNVTEIEVQDKVFDPDFHEAVARFAAGEDKKGKIIDVVQRGYMLGDKVLRYAKVVVGE